MTTLSSKSNKDLDKRILFVHFSRMATERRFFLKDSVVRMKPSHCLVALAMATLPLIAQERWWMNEPIRWLQTNLRETDAALDPKRLVDGLVEFRANVLLIGMGGITAYYPTHVESHFTSPYLPAGRDMFGEVLRLAHEKHIRVVGRFDLSKTRKEVFDAHPAWFYKKADGNPVIYNGLYSVCINGGYYSSKAMEILTEALERYEVDGLFFNMFGNQMTDYSGQYVGPCHCENCRHLYSEKYRREIPERPDADYQAFLYESRLRVAERIGKLIREKRPAAGFFNYIQEFTDGIMSESNTAVRRPLPLWPYSASDNVNRARNSQPDKMAVNLCMSFIDFPWRFAMVPQNEIRLRLWQNVANGGAAAINMHGTLDQEDQSAIGAARGVYWWLAEHEQYFVGQQSAAKVLLLGRPAAFPAPESSYRGLFRLLSEEHIPFAVSDNLDWVGKRQFDLVVASGWAPKELDGWVRGGGRLLLVSPKEPPLDLGATVKKWTGVQGYFRMRDHALFPSLKATNLLMLNGDYLEVQGQSPLTLIPPSMFGPPEKVHVDWKDTDSPGLILRDYGKGRVAWLPWDTGGLYYQHSSMAHHALLRDLIDHLLPNGRQIKTNAHPLVEMTLMRQGDRTLLHLINLSGHSDTAYFDPVPMTDIEIQVAGRYPSVRVVRNKSQLRIPLPMNDYTRFTLPRLGRYELIELR